MQSFGRTHTVTTTYADVAAKETVTATSTRSVAMQPNPAYGGATRLKSTNIITAATTVIMQPNPAYEVNTAQLELEDLV